MTRQTPTFSMELKKLPLFGLIAGVDEAGVAPLAGPVVAAAVILEPSTVGQLRSSNKWWYRIRDSKMLTHAARQELATQIIDNCVSFGIGSASVEEIDEINIFHARMLAMKRALSNLKPVPQLVLVDGNHSIPNIECKQICVVGGDAQILSIACASILAKVTRDDLLSKLHEEFPEYGFDKHKGYPTKLHYERLKQFGPCPQHRRSFNPVKLLLTTSRQSFLRSSPSIAAK